MSLTGMCGALAVLLYLIGVSAFVGCAMILVVLSVQFGLSYITQAAEKLNLKKADARLGTLKEVVSGIKPAKFLSYEEEYLRVIGETREKEVAHTRNFTMWQRCMLALGRGTPILAACAAFSYHGLAGHVMSAGDIFASLAAFQALRMPLINIPLGNHTPPSYILAS